MTSDKAKKIKAIVKGTAPKSTFGTNPNDPWSAKYNVAESNDLDRYLKSRGINPAFVAKDTKIAHAKSGEFAKWKRDHQFEEVQSEQIATTRHTPTEIRQHELKKRVHKHDEIGAVKSEAWDQPDYNQSIKARQAEADKKAKEQSKEGVNKLLNKYYSRNKKEHHVEEVELEEGKKKNPLEIVDHIYSKYKKQSVLPHYDDHEAVKQTVKHHQSKGASAEEISSAIHNTLTKRMHKTGYDSERSKTREAFKQAFKHHLGEEVEQIDELKKSTLASYTQKASADMSNREFAAGQRSGRGEGSVVTDPDIKKSRKRYVGIIKATHKLAKEERLNDFQKTKEDLNIDILENEEMWASRVIDEGKMGDLAGEIGRHLDKHIDDYKAHGGAEHLGYKTIDTAKKIVKSHGLHPNHAQKFVNDYVEKRLHEEEQIDEISQHTLDKTWHKRYQQATSAERGSPEWEKAHKSMKHINKVSLKRTQDKLMHMAKHDPEAFKKSAVAAADADRARGWSIESNEICPVCGCTPCNCTHISEDKFGVKTPSLEQIAKKHNVSMEELKKAHEEGIKVEIEHTKDKELASEIARDHLNEKPDYYKKLKKYVEQFESMTEDVFQDSQAATQTCFDGANSPDDTVQNRKRQLSKSARMVKALYKKHKISEDIYDAEKEDKSVATYGKKPKFTKNDDDAGEQAVAVMSGGKTLTGEPRDDVEIDPMMKTRPNGAEDEPKDKKKSKQ